MTTFHLGDLGFVTVSPLQADEHPFMFDTWMRSSKWRRRRMEAVVGVGFVLVARSEEGVALGWLALWGGRVAHAYVKSGFRGQGVMRALWEAAGRPNEGVDDAHPRVARVLEKLARRVA